MREGEGSQRGKGRGHSEGSGGITEREGGHSEGREGEGSQ